jgi:RNase H-like domain found in reverse transcriptase
MEAFEVILRNFDKPTFLLSRTLTDAETRYWPTELEVACLVWTIKKQIF